MPRSFYVAEVLLLVRGKSKMGKKVVTSIRIDQEVLQTAKKLGLSVSKVSENALKEAIRKLRTPTRPMENRLTAEGCPAQPVWWTGRDLNPRPPECKSGIHSRLNYRPMLFLESTCLSVFAPNIHLESVYNISVSTSQC